MPSGRRRNLLLRGYLRHCAVLRSRQASSSACAPCALLRAAGLITIGRPADAAALASGSGPGLKNARQPGESCDLLRTMQAVTRSTSGISGAAEPERIAGAGLLLFGGVGRRRRGPDRNREHRRQHQTELDILRPAKRHEIPRGADLREVWVNGGGFASQGGTLTTAEASHVEMRCRCPEGWYSWAGTTSSPFKH